MSAQAITVEEAKRRLDEGEAITFVDSRNEGAWRKSEWQLPDSRRVPADDVEAHLDEVPPGGGLIVPYGDADDVSAVLSVAISDAVASYLVTGGAGFIGSHLAVEWLRRGQRVRIADNLITGNLTNLAEARAAEFLEGDLPERQPPF